MTRKWERARKKSWTPCSGSGDMWGEVLSAVSCLHWMPGVGCRGLDQSVQRRQYVAQSVGSACWAAWRAQSPLPAHADTVNVLLSVSVRGGGWEWAMSVGWSCASSAVNLLFVFVSTVERRRCALLVSHNREKREKERRWGGTECSSGPKRSPHPSNVFMDLVQERRDEEWPVYQSYFVVLGGWRLLGPLYECLCPYWRPLMSAGCEHAPARTTSSESSKQKDPFCSHVQTTKTLLNC